MKRICTGNYWPISGLLCDVVIGEAKNGLYGAKNGLAGREAGKAATDALAGLLYSMVVLPWGRLASL